MQIPGPDVVEVVKNVWLYTKRRANIYLVADVSSSMTGEKLADAKDALRAFLDQVESDQERVGLIAFASEVREVEPLTQLDSGRPALEAAVDNLRAQGNTALIDGVYTALVKLRDLNDRERINAIVVMTDGMENRSRNNLATLTRSLGQSSASDLPVLVFCVAYGKDADLDALERISAAAGGFTERGTEETIRRLYEALSTYF
jgi:Ca-activated chloride channel family protein